MQSIKDLINNKDEKYIKSMVDRHKYVTTEYQDYGYRIALQLGQTDKISLYIKIAKEKPRALVEQAFSFAIDYPNAKNKGRLFMWKLKELEKEADERLGIVKKEKKKIVKRKSTTKKSNSLSAKEVASIKKKTDLKTGKSDKKAGSKENKVTNSSKNAN